MRALEGEQMLMRIHIGEADRHKGVPLYRALVELFRKEKLAGATVWRCRMGFGAHSVLHTSTVLRLSQDLPMVVEVVDSEERIEAVLPHLDEMVEEGLVTLEKVRVIRYAPKK